LNFVVEIQVNNTIVFEEVYRRYHERFYFFVLKRTSSEDIAEEVVQKAFIKLWEYRANLSPDLSIEIQLARITRTVLIDTLRKKAVERKVINHIGQRLPTVNYEDPVLEKELNHKIVTAIESLPPVCKKIFRLSREEGLSYKEIAQQLSISPKTVENQISKALRVVREVVAVCVILSAINK
jgi:RNA polymerase sigma-70 factor (family 1)